MDEAEAKELTQALAAVNSYYATAIDPKKLAWFALFGVAGKIYGPRIMAMMVRLKTEKPAPRVAPLAGTPVQPSTPAQPQARQTVPASSIPQNVRAMFSDPSFVADPGDEH